ncbi:MAG TPA: UrcA family protein [Rhizomicrobium sp.]|nr:UrcA family protein [Rhizomicrobium sp.]
MKTLHHLILVALTLAFTGGTAAVAQEKPRWKPRVESVIVRAGGSRDYHMALTASHLGKAFLVSASIPVPYSDLDLTKEADELGRRIRVAAELVCQQLDNKYPPAQYPVLEGYSGFDCVRMASKDSMEQADLIIANAKR